MLYTLIAGVLFACHEPLPDKPPEKVVGHDPEGDPAEEIRSFPDVEARDTEMFEDLAEQRAYEAFFDLHTIQEVHVELTPDAIDALDADGRAYVTGSVVINGTRFDNVGIRRKGSSTYQPFSEKPSLKIKLNAFVKGQNYAGLKRITLNSMVSDATQSKEVLVYHAFEQVGLPVPKANYAKVWVNDELYGLYCNLETMDEHWIKQRYVDASGDLWGTAPDDAEFSDDGLAYWTLKAGAGDVTHLQAVAAALDAKATDDFRTDLGAAINVDEFLNYWAWCITVGNQDGYPYHLNDVIVYSDPGNGGRLDFAPWGTDESWDALMGWDSIGGDLGLYCLSDDACRADLELAVVQATDAYEAMDLGALAESMWALSAPVVQEDGRRPWTLAEVAAARTALANDIAYRPTFVRTEMGL